MEGFKRAFHALYQNEGKVECPEEDDFVQLHAVLGDRDKQQAIREDNPKGKHCFELEVSPSACEGCPKNPLDKKKTKARENQELVRRHGETLDYITSLYDNVEMGLLSSAEQVTMREAALLRVVHSQYRAMKISGGMLKGLV